MVVNIASLFFSQIILFLVGFYYINWHIHLERWDRASFSALIINIIWIVISIILELTLYSLVTQNLFNDLPIIIVNIFVGLITMQIIYKNNWLKSLEIIGLAQISLFITSIFLTLLYDIIEIFLIVDNPQLDGAKFVFVLLILTATGVTVFISSWGDKLQLVKLRRVVIIVSIIPGTLYLLTMFVSQQVNYFDNFLQNFMISLILSAITMVVARRIAYKTISIQELREHHVLERGKPLLEVRNLKVYFPLLKGTLKRKVGDVKQQVTFYIVNENKSFELPEFDNLPKNITNVTIDTKLTKVTPVTKDKNNCNDCNNYNKN